MRQKSWAWWVAATVGPPLILATLLPLVPSNEWWIRIFDFPRAQITVLLGVLVLLAAFGGLWRARGGLFLSAGLAISLAYQGARILPYTPFYPEEVPDASFCPPNARLRYMEANVLQENRDARKLVSLVRARRPEVLLLTEADSWWADQVQSLRHILPHVVSVPQDNTYGMMLLSRRPLIAAEVRYLLQPDVPSIRAGVALASGHRIELYGVHPRPPVPGRDTALRDAELVIVGQEVRQRRRPTIVAGDLSDVAWSDTTGLFQEISGLLDPRVGRTLLPTFLADLPLLRWPLDYVFVSPGFTLLGMERLRDIGSDHLPILVELCASGLAAATLAPPPLQSEIKAEVREIVRDGREDSGER